jgi:DNA repair exonuclease SbcCD nuclease subunit
MLQRQDDSGDREMTDTTQILCTGDLHLGRHPTRVPERLDGQTFSPRAVWRDVVRTAVERDVDLVALTGDVADRENRYFEAYGAFESGVFTLDDEGIPVVTVAGNHDAETLPRMVKDIDAEHLHLLGAGGEWERWTLQRDAGPPVDIDGWSFPRSHVSQSPLEEYDLPGTDGPQVGLLHCDLDSPRSSYAPVDSATLRGTDQSAWLLGHIHVPGPRIEADPLTLYPGSTQPLDPGEPGVHGPWLVSLDGDGRVETEQLPLATVCYDEVEVDVTDADDVQAATSAVSTRLREVVDGDLQTTSIELFLPRLRLVGRTSAHAQLVEDRTRMEEQVATSVGSVDVRVESIAVDTRPDVDLTAQAEREGPVGMLADLLLTLENGESGDGVQAGEFDTLVDEAHEQMRDAYTARAYGPLRRHGDVDDPDRDRAEDVLEREARRLLDTLLQQKEGGA